MSKTNGAEPTLDMNGIREVQARILHAHNLKNSAGLSVKNANGDIDASTLGYEYSITTLTWIRKQLIKQKFYEEAPSDHMPVAISEGAYMDQITQNLELLTAGNSFEESIQNQGEHNAKIVQVNAGIKAVNIPVLTSVVGLNYTLIEIEQAMKFNNWDVVAAREKSRLKFWQLGIQKIAFLGVATRSDMPGLYNQADVNVNLNTLMSGKFSAMTSDQINTFLGTMIATYRSNCNKSAWPDRLLIPEDDYTSLGSQMSSTYPLKTKLQVMREAFQEIVGKKAGKTVEIQSCAYGEHARSGLTYDRVILYRAQDEEALTFHIPVWYTPTQPGTKNNFHFESVAFGQFSSPKAWRPLEMLYIDHS